MTERHLISPDDLIRVVRSDPDAIECSPHVTGGLWVYYSVQADEDDWDEHGVVMSNTEFDDMMRRHAGADATAPEESEVPA